MAAAVARSFSALASSLGTYFVTSMALSPYAARVASMLRAMKGASSDFSLGLTLRLWMSAGKIPPTTIEVTSSSTVPMTGSRQERVQMTDRNIAPHMIEATARIDLVGSTALASVYWMPVMSDEVDKDSV